MRSKQTIILILSRRRGTENGEPTPEQIKNLCREVWVLPRTTTGGKTQNCNAIIYMLSCARVRVPYLQWQTMSLNMNCMSARTKTIGEFHIAILTILSLHNNNNNEHKPRNKHRIFAHGSDSTVHRAFGVWKWICIIAGTEDTQPANEKEIINFSAYFWAKWILFAIRIWIEWTIALL